MLPCSVLYESLRAVLSPRLIAGSPYCGRSIWRLPGLARTTVGMSSQFALSQDVRVQVSIPRYPIAGTRDNPWRSCSREENRGLAPGRSCAG